MAEQTTITITEETLTRFHFLKESLNVEEEGPDLTNEMFLHRLMDTWEATDDTSESVEEIVEQLKNQLSMVNDPGVQADVETLCEEIDQLKRLVENVPENTAEKVSERYR